MTGEPKPVVEGKKAEPVVEEKGLRGVEVTILSDDSSSESNDSSSESAVKDLRGHWELASVLNFLNV